MDLRTRFVRSLRFNTDAKPLFWHMFGLMPGTIERWHKEGLPIMVHEDQIVKHFGFHGLWLGGMVSEDGKIHPINVPFPAGFHPPFEKQIIEDTDRYTIQRDHLGRVTKIIKGVSTLPRVMNFAIKTPSDWPSIKNRLRFSISRFGRNWLKRYEEIRAHGLPAIVGLSGFFDFPRELMGEVTLSRFYYKHPGLMHDFLETYSDLIVNVAEEILSSIEVDAVSFGEDMAYRHGPMMSPTIFREFLMPYYKKTIDPFYHRGTRIFCVDTDGNLDMLIPLLIESGINVVGPVEVQAGNDLVDLRSRFGTKIAFFGGLDKLALTAGKEGIDAELNAKLPLMLKTGGYNVGLDHRVVPQTSLESFTYFTRRVREIIAE